MIKSKKTVSLVLVAFMLAALITGVVPFGSQTAQAATNVGIITGLSVKDTANEANWSAMTDIQVGSTLFGDRTYKIKSLPSIYLGSDWIRTANDSKAYTSSPLVTFTVTADCSVYVAYDDRIASRPSWLTGWVDTGDNLVDDEAANVSYSLYKKGFTASSLVSLGSNNAISGSCMYSIIVKATGGIPTPLYGDLNKDNAVDSTDLTILKRYILKITDFDSYQIRYSDLNLDNVVDSTDLTILKRYILKIINTLPFGDIKPTPTATPTSTPTTTPATTSTSTPTATPALDNVYYVSSSGKSSNNGSGFNDALDIKTAINNARAGDTLMLQGGIYKISYSSGYKNTINLSQSGTSSKPIKIETYNNERAVIDFQFPEKQWVQDSYGFYVTGNYWIIKNIDITRAGYQGVYITGAHNTFENCRFYDNRNTGIEINKGGSYTTLINCDAFRNYDPKKNGSMADGFGPKQEMGPGNKLIGCRAWENSDDGYDCFDSPETVVFENCWAFRNGIDIWGYGNFQGNANGFKIGGNYKQGNHVLTNCIVFGQPNKGFDQNNNTGGLTLYNCLAYNNGTNFALGGNVNAGQKHILKNNISLSGPNSISNASQYNNTWNVGFSVSSSDFLSLDTSLATIDRNSDGSIPETNLFRLKSNSPLINAGVNVGLKYNGSAPDIGAFETSY